MFWKVLKRKTKDKRSLAVMSGDKNGDEEKSQELTSQTSTVRPNVLATGLRAGGLNTEHST